MAFDSSITTIIPTTAIGERAHCLQRAIGSIRASSSDPVKIVVVVNGQRFDRQLCDWMARQADVRLEFLAQPSLTAALLKGRQLVGSRFFSFLDDDDEYLPGTLDLRRAVLENDSAVDLVVSNGFRHTGGTDQLAFRQLPTHTADPLRGVLSGIWLCSCNGLYRTSSVSPRAFEDLHARAEWTWLAFSLALEVRKVAALDIPTFRIHDTPGSLSKSPEYQAAYLSLFDRMLSRNPPADVARLIKQRAAAAWHDRSVQSLGHGKRADALLAHARSLLLPGGLRYLSYSRRLLRGR